MEKSYHVLTNFLFLFLQKVYHAKHWTSITKVSTSDLQKKKALIKLSTIKKLTPSWVASREKKTSDCPRDSQAGANLTPVIKEHIPSPYLRQL